MAGDYNPIKMGSINTSFSSHGPDNKIISVLAFRFNTDSIHICVKIFCLMFLEPSLFRCLNGKIIPYLTQTKQPRMFIMAQVTPCVFAEVCAVMFVQSPLLMADRIRCKSPSCSVKKEWLG